jgi:hypothetical protein
MRTSPSIVPHGADHDIYLVLEATDIWAAPGTRPTQTTLIARR